MMYVLVVECLFCQRRS